jgi:hypothetical protein
MRLPENRGKFYSLYLSHSQVELRFNEDDGSEGRFITCQKDYQNILEFGQDLAKLKGVKFRNYVDTANHYGTLVSD